MKAMKVMKKIIALGTGLTMLGATILGATAADLGQYPTQYIKDGNFDGLMVVGATASTSDVLGVVDIATSLQFESKVDKVVGDVNDVKTNVLTGDAYQFGSGSNILEINEFLKDVKSTVDTNDFKLLKETTMRTRKGSTDVKQYIKFTDSSLQVVYDEKDDVIGNYLTCKDKDVVFEYNIQFSDGLYSDVYESRNSNVKAEDNQPGYLNDLENEYIEILGHIYTISEAEIRGDDIKLTLMTGSTEVTMNEYESKIVKIGDKEYDVNVMIISDGTEGVKLMVNNEVTNTLYEGDTYTFKDGTILGIKGVLANEGNEEGGADVVSFYIGANKIEFDGNEVSIEDERIEDAIVTIEKTHTGNEVRISTIKYTLSSDYKKSGDLVVREGEGVRENLDEPQGMLGTNWDIKYMGLTSEDDYDVTIETDGDDKYTLNFITQDGTEYNMPLVYVESSTSLVMFGEDSEYKLVINGTEEISVNNYFILPKANENKDEITKVLQLEDIDEEEQTISFTEIGTNENIDVRYNNVNNTGDLLVGGETYSIKSIDSDSIIISAASDRIRLKGGHTIDLLQNNTLVFTTPASLTDDGKDQTFNIVLDESSEDVDLNVEGITLSSSDDLRIGMTSYGINIVENTDGVDELTLTIPDEQVYPQVVLTGSSYSFDTTTEQVSGIVVQEYKAIKVGASVLDTEVSNIANQNVVVVGGPCVNSLAATILGIPGTMPGCYEQFPVKDGEGIIKMIDNGEHVAMLVAGYTSTDTRNAAKIMAEFKNYNNELSNKTEVLVSGTTIKAPVVEVVNNETLVNETTE